MGTTVGQRNANISSAWSGSRPRGETGRDAAGKCVSEGLCLEWDRIADPS